MIEELAQKAKRIAPELAALKTADKNNALLLAAEYLEKHKKDIIEANKKDIERSETEKLAAPLLKRLRFDEAKIAETVKGLKSLITLPDPAGNVVFSRLLDDGLKLYKVSCPIGVIGVIFESRPDALVQISSLCLKSGNCTILKGGREAQETNKVLAELIKKAGRQSGIPEGWLELVETRQDVNEMLRYDKYIDLIIPRGSNEFVRYIMDNTRIPVLGHADGICHCYVDKDADLEMAVNIIADSKAQYPAVCNALETLLVHRDAAQTLLPSLKKRMDSMGVSLSGCEETRRYIEVEPASEEDWKTEYLDLKLSIRITESLDAAVEHINYYGSGHTDSIITSDMIKAEFFMNRVDSANVFCNASTRFSDGYRYGLGAEVGISTSKIHARGPVGLEGLVIYKYRLFGEGHIVSDYVQGKRNFKFQNIS